MNNPLVPGEPSTDNAVIAHRCKPDYKNPLLRYLWWLWLPILVVVALGVPISLIPPIDVTLLRDTGILILLCVACHIGFAFMIRQFDSVYLDIAPYPERKERGFWRFFDLTSTYYADAIFRIGVALRNSRCIAEAQHLFCGILRGTQVPLLLDVALLKQHTLIIGGTRSGKTMKIAFTLFLQLLGFRSVLVVVDAKGDNTLAKALQWLAHRFGLPFFHVSNDRKRSSMRWNPFLEPVFAAMSPAEKAEVLTNGFGVESGAVYGPSYFASEMRAVLIAAFTFKPDICSFAELLKLITWKQFRKKSGILHEQWVKASQAVNYIRELAGIEQINQTEGKLFSLCEAIKEPGIVHFHMSPRVNETSASILARLALRVLFAASIRRDHTAPDIYACVDEVGTVIQRALETQLRQAADARLFLMLTAQSLYDLNTQDRDFTKAVLANTAVKFFVTMKDDDGAEYMRRIGGQIVRLKRSRSMGVAGDKVTSNTTESEERADRFDQDAINAFNADPSQILVEASPHSGFTRLNGPQIVEMIWPLWSELVAEFEKPGWDMTGNDEYVVGATLSALPSRIDEDDDEDPPVVAPPEPKPDPTPASIPLPKRPTRKEKKAGGPEIISPLAAKLNGKRP